MTSKPSIAVAVNNYNNENFIESALESIINQKDLPDQIILVDDGSTDNSRKIVETVKKNLCKATISIETIYCDNRGQLNAVHEAVKICRTDVVCLLDGDDLYHRLHVKKARDYWSRHASAHCLYNRSVLLADHPDSDTRLGSSDVQNSLLGPVRVEQTYDHGFSAILAYHDYWYYSGNRTSCLSFSANHLRSLNLPHYVKLLQNIKHNADLILLLLSSLNMGRKIYYPEKTVFYRAHAGQVSRNNKPDANFVWAWNNYTIREIIKSQFTHFQNSRLIASLELATVPEPTERHIKSYKRLGAGFGKQSQPRGNYKQTLSWRITSPIRFIAKNIGYPLFGKQYMELQ